MKQIHYAALGETVYRETLSNGLPICVVPRPNCEKQFAFFAVRYGGMNTRIQTGRKPATGARIQCAPYNDPLIFLSNVR